MNRLKRIKCYKEYLCSIYVEKERKRIFFSRQSYLQVSIYLYIYSYMNYWNITLFRTIVSK
ncbi:hypothetical protein BDA99DRAFT_139419 [Phascolomyces articulosus]|uniref:Uncharacterized protein n=1 Tax=Phascolomyces articulosus TaxID=60185 RepID=A0AAD5PDC8_9FUNG|nr:hypothetical protein BDA99DRAFT_139419 [Phascolomyces articulosus]